MTQTFYKFSSVKSRLTLGQVKGIIMSTKCDVTRATFVGILEDMLVHQRGWCYLMYDSNDFVSMDRKDMND